MVRKYGTDVYLSPDETRILTEIGFSKTGIKNNFELFIQCKKELDFIYELALLKGRAREKSNPCGWCIKALKGKVADKKNSLL